MTEQYKRELMLKAAVKFKGVWPDVREDQDCLIVCKQHGEIRASMINSSEIDEDLDKERFNFICTRTEYEAFIDSLFEGAPDDAEYYLAPTGRTYPCWIKDLCADDDFCQYKVIIEDAMQSYTDKEWQRYNANKVLEGGVLIPHPRKKPSFIGDAIRRSIDQAYNEAIKKAPNTPTMNDDVTDTNVGEWNGAGLPPVGTVCEYATTEYCGARPGILVGEWYKCTVIAYHDGFVWTSDNGLRQLSLTKFRPLKTEAEKEREELIKILYEIFAHGDTLHKSIESLIDAGWRPNE